MLLNETCFSVVTIM